MNIPVFHDDQHGTAIIVAAAVYNGLRLVGKEPEQIKLVASGAGAAALACLNQLVALGVKRENIWVTDIAGVVYEGRTEQMDRWKAAYAQDTPARGLGEVIGGADIFLGLSAPGVLKPEMVAQMADRPLIMALANPVPEIMPDKARAVRDDVIMATGRSDFPNQVNNVLCFPYIFRGALDCGAATINEEMKLACVKAIADLAMAEPNEVVAKAMGGDVRRFGPDFLIPSPFDPAAHPGDRPGGRQGGDGQRRGEPADRGFRGLSGAPGTFRLPFGADHEADLRARQAGRPSG